jgi:alpha-beta hydrolase superfamily lysophospholipase
VIGPHDERRHLSGRRRTQDLLSLLAAGREATRRGTAGSKDKTLKLYDGAFHDLLNDTDKQTVMGDIQRWLDAHLPPF